MHLYYVIGQAGGNGGGGGRPAGREEKEKEEGGGGVRGKSYNLHTDNGEKKTLVFYMKNCKTRAQLIMKLMVLAFFGPREPVWAPAGGRYNCCGLSYLSKNPISYA